MTRLLTAGFDNFFGSMVNHLYLGFQDHPKKTLHRSPFSSGFSIVNLIKQVSSARPGDAVIGEQCSNPFVVPLNWLIKNGFPHSWIVIISSILGIITPELIINQQGYCRSQQRRHVDEPWELTIVLATGWKYPCMQKIQFHVAPNIPDTLGKLCRKEVKWLLWASFSCNRLDK